MSGAENKAVFLSYASQDAEAACLICETLRAAGVEVWFDQSELRGGDAWDAKIRGQIASCALFVPIISANTQARREGYFRLEWRLAAQRTHMMSQQVAFLLPVVIDATRDADSDVPAEFKSVQWTRIGPARDSGQALDEMKVAAFAERVRSLLGQNSAVSRPAQPDTGAPLVLPPKHDRTRTRVLGGALVAATVMGLVLVRWAPWREPNRGKPTVAPDDAKTVTPLATVSSDAMAVLPFAVMGGRPSDVERADMLHGEVISALSRVRGLDVLSRDAVLSYREEKQREPRSIAQQLRVGWLADVMLVSDGTAVKVDARLINTGTGALDWSDTFRAEATSPDERAALSARLAQKLAAARHATSPGDDGAVSARPPTRNPEAYALYQRARATGGRERRINLLRAAIAKDSDFAAAYVLLVDAHGFVFWFDDPSPARKSLAKEALDGAVRIAPDAPETHLARGIYLYRCERDYRRALEAFHIAERHLPGDARVRTYIGFSERRLGRLKESLAALEQALVLEPRDRGILEMVMETCFHFRRFDVVRDYGLRYREIGGRGGIGQRFVARATYELTGDKAQFERERFGPANEDSTAGQPWEERYLMALLRQDFVAAEKLLDEPALWPRLKITWMEPSSRGLDAAPTVHRAYLALARGDREAAKLQANDALKRLALEVQTEPDGYRIRVAMAEMMAIAGRGEEAVVAMKKVLAEIAREDAFDGMKYQHRLACVYAAAGMTREALEQLARLMQQPCEATPTELREEPMLGSLRNNPEFERILASAKRL